jgi:hypothetical protein
MIFSGTTQLYRGWEGFKSKDVNLDSDTIKCLLVTHDYVPDLVNHSLVSDITNELASQNGYSRQSLNSVSYIYSSGAYRFLSNNIVFTAIGGSLIARRYVIFNDTTLALVCTGLLNSADLDVVVTDGNDLTISIPTTGLFSVTEA